MMDEQKMMMTTMMDAAVPLGVLLVE